MFPKEGLSYPYEAPAGFVDGEQRLGSYSLIVTLGTKTTATEIPLTRHLYYNQDEEAREVEQDSRDNLTWQINSGALVAALRYQHPWGCRVLTSSSVKVGEITEARYDEKTGRLKTVHHRYRQRGRPRPVEKIFQVGYGPEGAAPQIVIKGFVDGNPLTAVMSFVPTSETRLLLENPQLIYGGDEPEELDEF